MHITNICRSVYIGIQRDDNVCHHFTTDAMKTLFCAFVLSKLDCCNSLLLGSPKHLPQNSNRSKLALKLASRNISNSFIRNFTGTGFIKNPVQTRFLSYSSFTEACQLVDMAQEPPPPPPFPPLLCCSAKVGVKGCCVWCVSPALPAGLVVPAGNLGSWLSETAASR